MKRDAYKLNPRSEFADCYSSVSTDGELLDAIGLEGEMRMPNEIESDRLKKYKEACEFILGKVRYEDTLIGNRFNWFLTSQSIFLAAYAISFDKNSSEEFFRLIPLVALYACVLNYSSLLAALIAIYRFCRQLDKKFPEYSKVSRERILGSLATHVFGQVSAFHLPAIFIVLWIFSSMRDWDRISKILLQSSDSLNIAVGIWVGLTALLSLLWILTFPYRSELTLTKQQEFILDNE